jgi:hypothetical protein
MLFAEIAALPPEPLPNDLRSSVLAAIQPSAEIPPERTPSILGAAAFLQFAAAIAILALAGILFGADIDQTAARLLETFEMWTASFTAWMATFENLPPLPEFPHINAEELLDLTVSFLPIVLSGGLLWLVGNGILIRSLSSRSARKF